MENRNQGISYNVDLVQKYNITNSYSGKYLHKKGANHSLLTGYFDDGIIYSLYVRDGSFMVLVDAFKNLNEANQQARDIVNEYQELKNYLTHKESERKS
ncbi:hypothetical protein ABLB69_20095 [Xenorhabdus khoisanae]|uniref:hypothetical protein n=1 Tax=Xenorhabdus khoisanae TaxID=880157 RepID=UPI0032B73916